MSLDVEVHGLRAGYAGSTVLHDLELSVAAGTALGVLGRNGAGKTTLVHALLGMVRVDAGQIRIGGRDLTGRRTHIVARSGVRLAPQGRRVFGPLTVQEHLRLSARPGEWTAARVLSLFPRLGVRRDHRSDRLSGGEQQMLSFARALVANPRLLLLDEPSDGLAPAVLAQVESVITELIQQGTTVVVVEQRLSTVLSVTDHVVIMDRGRIVHRATTNAFRQDSRTARDLLTIR